MRIRKVTAADVAKAFNPVVKVVKIDKRKGAK